MTKEEQRNIARVLCGNCSKTPPTTLAGWCLKEQFEGICIQFANFLERSCPDFDREEFMDICMSRRS